MKRALNVLALLVVLSAAMIWFALGANRGWTKTSVPEVTVDEVTGLEDRRYVDRFVPGLDFIGAALVAGGLLAGGSLFLSKSKKNTNNKTQTV